ncbi:hypothetical protein COL30_11995 [Bacillus pseudomycoides]|uniref:hypothetical protein n=1 Tax=Bacillus pseudomycoides TaxID=64104 RepID=UPI000BEDF8C1|nr:hypothetical protein [Bacillus pseudomycoides]PED73067.1 hypothetical protein CON97_05530 [Bacillus pseudomycoides]PEP61170.1 hypothetical protein CN591_18470 [Bacillus pseudomycoides]PFW67976.1 hypothetical protein COL25_13775 [Bacillus pseudomycoides]PFW80005.1 hypothetical protein COL30_11995 [Bacillus pseudomycoides]PFZ08447.1 hypothetical protein COL60_16615 [Bacillus pseudomycoides]
MSNTVKVQRLNKVLHIEKDFLESYLNDGFDQIGEEGKIIKRATGGRNVTVSEHNVALDRIEELEAELKELKAPKKSAAK